MTWYASLRGIESRGSQAERPGSLAGLAQARREHLGQFFTPDVVAKVMWDIASPAMAAAVSSRTLGRVSILDNSVGTGRLLQYADPSQHALYGVDVDTSALAALGQAAEAAGFTCEFNACGMESIRPRNFDVALINPPFSVHLDSPLLEGEFPCTCYGRYGPGTSAVSHAYALAQAVDACRLVVALLPSTFAAEVFEQPSRYVADHDAKRLAALIDLPPKLFMEEGTEVRVSLIVFAQGKTTPVRLRLEKLGDALPDLGLRIDGDGGREKLSPRGIVDDGPAITLPVTGNNVVRVAHDGRKVRLKFACGFTQARVLNAVMVSRVAEDVPKLRRPKGVEYSGQGVLDLEVHLAQPDPVASFREFLDVVETAAGECCDVDEGVWHHLTARIKRSRRQAIPLRHTIFVPEGVAGAGKLLVGRAKKTMVADPKVWGSPVIKPGQDVTFIRADDGSAYAFELAGRQFDISPEDLYVQFDVTAGAADSGWQTVHEGLEAAFPDMARSLRSRACALGIDKWLSWDYQLDDLVELCMKAAGSVAAWDMGLGKARLAVAMIMLIGCKHGLIVTEAGLTDEMEIELNGLPIPKEEWQVVKTPEQALRLRRINVISYERLRLPVYANRPRVSYGKLLRRRVSAVIADEGDVLANPDSDQSRALWALSPKRKYVLTGTPIANYPRDVLPVLAYAGGDGTAAQPWGYRRGYLEPNWRRSMSYAQRGIDAFRETFVTVEWCTREFEDTLEGAAREVPKITNLDRFREMVAPHLKRRIVEEPDVAKYIKTPPHDEVVVEVPWDQAHLAHYLAVAEEFADWYRNAQRDKGMRNNLIALLARIRAVSFASDFPQHGVEGFGRFMPLTSKQRWVIDETELLAREGKKTIVYAENPGQVELFARELRERDVDCVVFHGGIPIKKRTRELNERFRWGSATTLLATLGVTQKGLNLWQAEEEIFASRSWSSTVERQAIKRALRPQQTKRVRVRFPHLPGGIDIYKDQIVSFKKDAAHAGLDWATPEKDDVEFLHLTTVIGRFCEGLANLHGVERGDLRGLLEKEALYA